jgi:mannobiose 2-epimerase
MQHHLLNTMKSDNRLTSTGALLPSFIRSAIVASAFFLIVPTQKAQDIPSSIAGKALGLLHSSVIDFYFPDSVDEQYGGYHQDLDETGKFRPGSKFLTFQARQLWFTSHMAANGIRRAEMLAAAGNGFEFLTGCFLDTQHGGYYSMVSRDGFPTDPRKHTYLNAFALYSLVEFHRATGDQYPLQLAIQLFHTLEEKARDRQNGGYFEFFLSDWTRITTPQPSAYVGAINTKTYNTHLHLLEAFTSLYQETGLPEVGNRLGELIYINTSTVRHPEFNANIDGWHNNWTVIRSERNFRASYGHDVECVWLVLEAAEALGWPRSVMLPWAERTCQYSIQYGYDAENGGFHDAGPFGAPASSTGKIWWVQAEALVSMLTMAQITGEPAYHEAFTKTFDFVTTHQINPDGSWYATLGASGNVENSSLTSMWQSAYHAGRALLRVHQLLRNEE